MTSGALSRVSAEGYAVVPIAEAWGVTAAAARDEASVAPWTFASRLLGREPLLVERQPIRPVAAGRSFASTNVDTPLHTDSQLFLEIPAAIQILLCVKQARSGGESVLVDCARLLARLESERPHLATALFEIDRTQRFYFGDVRGPTVARRGGHVAWTVAPSPVDAVGRDLAAELAREPPITVLLRPGEALVASNHRVVHGRRAFEGERELVRLLVWLEPDGATADARAREVAPALSPALYARLRAVFAMLRGVPPAKVARDAGVDEATLYAWRDRFSRGGAPALTAG